MSERKYSVAEIDRMRDAIFDADSYEPGGGGIRPELVETRLRTYMVNGTEPSELEQKAREAQDRWKARQR